MANWDNSANTSMQEAVNNNYLTNAEAAALRSRIDAWAGTIGRERDIRFDIPDTRKWAEVKAENHTVKRVTINMG